MKTAVIYARVSTQEQRGNYSISSQIDNCFKFLQKSDYKLVGNRFIDPETGLDIQNGEGAIPAYVDNYTSREINRPSLDDLFNYMKTNTVEVIVVYSIDRLARDPYIRQTLEIGFQKFGAVVEYATGNYEPTAEGEVRKDLEATFAKWENAKRVERITRGMQKKAKNGLFVGAGKIPFGYALDPKSKPGGLSIIERKAVIIRKIFNMYVYEHFSIRKIVRELNNKLIPTPSGNKKWGKSTVHRILRNTIYVGYTYYNRHKKVGGKLILKERTEWIKIKTPNIVAEEIFDEAKRYLDINREISRKKPKREYLMSGMIFCKHCGKSYISQTSLAGKNRRKNDSQSYRHRKSEGHCFNRQISARILEPIIWNKVVDFLLDPKVIRTGYEQSIEEELEARDRRMEKHKKYLKEIDKIEERKQKLIRAYTDPDIKITKSEYIDERNNLEMEIKKSQNSVNNLETYPDNIPSQEDFENLEDFAEEVSEALINNGNELSKTEKRKILQLLGVRVLLNLDGTGVMESLYSKISYGFLSQTQSNYVPQRPLLPMLFSHVPVP
jgi:site-specific DNA recombinase